MLFVKWAVFVFYAYVFLPNQSNHKNGEWSVILRYVNLWNLSEMIMLTLFRKLLDISCIPLEGESTHYNKSSLMLWNII